MGAEPPSPSASSTLLPFLHGRTRRGSLASITSRSGIGKDVLAQALDDIHNEASKCDTLTSFHDYDGGGGRAGPKEIVSNGVSGLYNKLRNSVGGGSAKEGKLRPSSSASRDSSGLAESVRSVSPSALRASGSLSSKRHVDATPTSTRAASPAVPSFASSGITRSGPQVLTRHQVSDQASIVNSLKHTPSILSQTSSESVEHQTDFGRITTRDPSLREGNDQNDTTWGNNDPILGVDNATSRASSRSREQPSQEYDQKDWRQRTSDDLDQAIDDESDSGEDFKGQLLDPLATHDHTISSRNSEQGSITGDVSSRARLKRPPMTTVGVSHLPGFLGSHTSSTTDVSEATTLTSSRLPQNPVLEPSPNINSGLQRRRTGLKPLPTSSHAMSVSSHLKRRVISKEFWMKDENAKGCHRCGQSFSTFRRKHHCRTCGNIFDAGCTTLVAGKPFGQPGTLRVCKSCEAWIFGTDDDDSSVFSEDGEEHIRSPYDNDAASDTGTDEEHAIKKNSLPFSRTDTEVTTPSIGIPASRRNREAKRRSAVIEFDAFPPLARPSSSHSLASLSRRPRSSSHRRRHSRYQGSRGLRSSVDERAPFHQDGVGDPQLNTLLPAFHDDNIIDPDLAAFLSDDGSDGEENPTLDSTVMDGTIHSPGEREKLGYSGLFASALRKGRSRLGDKSNAGSSVRGVKDDGGQGTAKQHLQRSRQNRVQSFGSFTKTRPSPRRSRSILLTAADNVDTLGERPSTPPAGIKSDSPSIVCSSALCGQHKPKMELNRASYDHVSRLLSQLVRDSKIPFSSAWEKALMPIIMQCTGRVEPAVQLGDDMDIRHYIKLKKVPGGRPGDTSYVSGVVFSKNVARKSMSRAIIRPRIAIVTFAIEYARHETHFMSLEPVIAQEQEYLENLVTRIVALGPHVLLVQRHVSGSALRLLEKAGITVAYNIKESVLAAVARVTQTTMIKSVDKLSIDPSHLGRCDSFEVKTFLSDGARKTYVYLSGCKPDLGCTVVLRGADTRTLRSIKRITEFMCYVAYNLKLENYLMRDEFISIPSTAGSSLEAQSEPFKGNGQDAEAPNSDTDTRHKYERIENESRSRILSASPFVVFMQPYILTQLRELEKRLATLKMHRDRYAAADSDEKSDETATKQQFELVKPEMVNAPPSSDQPKAVREYLHAVHEVQFEKAMHTYETQERLWDSFMSGDAHPFDPFSHQKIDVLYSTVSSITSAPCVGPEVIGIGFYAGYSRVEANHDEDTPLGQYIEDTYLGANDTCSECGKKMYDHYRQYVHGNGQLTVSIQRQPAKMRGYNNSVLMWSKCRICRHETTVTQMSDHAWKYSFAKYLELSFWSKPLHPRAAGTCKHDIHRDFLRCFGFQDSVVRFQYDSIETYDVIVPRARVTWKVEADLTVKNQQYSLFAQRLEAFTDSIKNRLGSINVDTLDEKKSIEAQEKLDELRERAGEDHDMLLEKLQQKYAGSRYYELIPLNRALRWMDEKAIAWDEEFNNFERDYFPSETDIRKLATVQLRNMFLESEPPPSSVASDSDTEDSPDKSLVGQGAVPKLSRQDEIPSEKAQDVLHSAIEEHRASLDENGIYDGNIKTRFDSNIEASLGRRVAPRRQHEDAIQRDEVKHLDLALPVIPAEPSLDEDKPITDQDASSAARLANGNEQAVGESSTTQPKLLSSGLLERIEQIRSTRAAGAVEQELTESRIPRLVDVKRTEVSPAPAPPLLRAQSQPLQVPRRSTDSTSDQTNVAFALPNEQASSESPVLEKRLGDRLGVGRLAVKVGKIAPSLIPRSIPSKHREHLVSSVSALAKHFEQMSREFEKERLRERRQRALRSRQARANPLASSRPVVEVYENATDAVGEKAAPDNENGDENVERRDMDDAVSKSQPDDRVAEELTQPIAQEDDIDAPSEGDVSSHHTGLTDSEQKTRSRDASDPTSGLSSSSVMSPTSVPDLAELTADLSIPEHRKNVWFKYLADFWSKRSASGWANLEYPLHINEHVFEDSDIIVREDEPSSVVALSLACADYRNKMNEFRSQPSKQPASKHYHSVYPMTAERDTQGKLPDIEASLLSDTGTHLKYSFAHGPVKASCKIFYAESFDALRRRCGISDRFIESMSRCLKFDSKGGKTKSLFLRTLDNRFIIKSLQEVELKAFTKFAPDYFSFMSYTLFHGVPSVIAKMFGLFQVNIRNPATGVDFSYYLIVMENLFYERTPTRRFDLKGSMRNRKIESTGEADEVLLDENLVETIFEKPLFVREHAKKLLQASVFNDTLFLMRQNIMDYSLMAGFDDDRKELVVGIIDCIRTYTWDKKLESWIKDRGKNKPTVTSPKDYRSRFRMSMMAYCLLAPSVWHQFTAQMAQPKTLKEKEETEDTDVDRS